MNAPLKQKSHPGGTTRSIYAAYSLFFVVSLGGYLMQCYGQRQSIAAPAPATRAVAGNGEVGYSGDGGSATHARFSYLMNHHAADGKGNLYIADTMNNRVRKVGRGGTVVTIAGTGAPGFSGDGGAAARARLNRPKGIALDRSGQLYFADTRNHRVRRIDERGTITTVAGSGTPGFTGDHGPATRARLLRPSGVAVDAAGNLYIADNGNKRIRKVSPYGRISTVMTGVWASQLALDRSGNLNIADMGNHCVRQLKPDGSLETVAGTGKMGFSGDGGLASEAKLAGPQSVAADRRGNLYIADTYNGCVRKVSSDGAISTVAGVCNPDSGVGTPRHRREESPALILPTGVAVDSFGSLYVTDGVRHRILKVIG